MRSLLCSVWNNNSLSFTQIKSWETWSVTLNYTWNGSPMVMEYSTNGTEWSTYTLWTAISLNYMDKVYFRNSSETDTNLWWEYKFSMSWHIAWGWDATTLLNKFGTTSVWWRYGMANLFAHCSALITPPELPATTVWVYGYQNMFAYCTNLLSAPKLPATNLTDGSYADMFMGCSSLEIPPELPATTVNPYWYRGMFRDCVSLSRLPELPATNVSWQAYSTMFMNCSKIKVSETQGGAYTVAYSLPASWSWTFWQDFSNNMFYMTGWTFTGSPTGNTTYYLDCTPEDWLSFNFETNGTIKLVKTWSPADVDLEYHWWMWRDYTIWDTITVPAGQKIYFRRKFAWDSTFSTSLSDYYSFQIQWDVDVAWDVNYLLNKNSTMTLSDYCFVYLFKNCSTIKTAPRLPATELTSWCYCCMFRWCSALKKAPELPGVTAKHGSGVDRAYTSMFYLCSSLLLAPKINLTTFSDWTCSNMFGGCSKIMMSTTKTWEYSSEYRIPDTGTWTESWTNVFTDMFDWTWWTFAGTPTINTTYYQRIIPLYFTAIWNENYITFEKNGSPTQVNLEYSFDLENRDDVVFWEYWRQWILQKWETIYFRNKSTTDTQFSLSTSDYYHIWTPDIDGNCCFETWWDVTTLLNKYWTDTLSPYCFAMLLATSTFSWTPELKAMNLANYCYVNMFQSSQIDEAPVLPATVMAEWCYFGMFYQSNIKQNPVLASTQLAISCYEQMFMYCWDLETIPSIPATTLPARCCYQLFNNCGKIKLSETQGWEYVNEYRVPTTWTWTDGGDALRAACYNTSWTYQWWNLVVNTSYYTSNQII